MRTVRCSGREGGVSARGCLPSRGVSAQYGVSAQGCVYPSTDFPLTLARWAMASEHCRRTSDFLSYWPGLPSGISKIREK